MYNLLQVKGEIRRSCSGVPFRKSLAVRKSKLKSIQQSRFSIFPRPPQNAGSPSLTPSVSGVLYEVKN